jgi:hypothetical protein
VTCWTDRIEHRTEDTVGRPLCTACHRPIGDGDHAVIIRTYAHAWQHHHRYHHGCAPQPEGQLTLLEAP